MAPRLLVIGGGKMGSALLNGLITAGWAPPGDLAVADPDPVRRQSLTEAHPGLTVVAGPVAADGAVLAVKPDIAEAVLRSVSEVGIARVLSIVAGVSTARLEAAMAPGAVVIRSMPNSPALIGAGVAAMSGGDMATASDLDWAEGILGAVGTVVRLPERQLDAVTAVSGSGPAYLFLVAEALVEGAVSAGLSREVSQQLVVGTLLGSARMMAESGEDPAKLREAVTSPGGTTAAALRTLEFKAVRSAFIEAVAAATERSRQLGR
jgi:pyrroline-5-carboxylate reductase